MNKHEIIQRLRTLELPRSEYWLVTGSAMVLYGIKDETHDIDMGCSRELAGRLEADGYAAERLSDGSRKFVIGSEIEIFEGWLYDRVETVEGIPVISLRGLVQMKEALGREKDRADLAIIREFMRREGISKCKMCGGDILLSGDRSTGTCG